MPSSPISSRGKRLAILLAVVVYLPMIHNSLFGPPAFVPWRINEFWRFTELFPYRTLVWPVHQVFVQGADGEWRQVPQAPLFRHHLFGRMTRMDMLQLMLRFRRTDDPTTLKLKKSVFAKVCHAFAEAHDADNGEAAAVLVAEGTSSHSQAGQRGSSDHRVVAGGVREQTDRRWSSWPPVDYSDLNQETTFEYRKQPSPRVR